MKENGLEPRKKQRRSKWKSRSGNCIRKKQRCGGKRNSSSAKTRKGKGQTATARIDRTARCKMLNV